MIRRPADAPRVSAAGVPRLPAAGGNEGRLYFAYGSNMDPGQMRRRCPGARALGPARLPGHRLVFTRDSIPWGGGVAHVEPAAGEEVWGVLWLIDEAAERALDRYENVHQGAYRRAEVTVEASGRAARALIYLANPTGERRPSRRYLAALRRGARAYGLPARYVAGIAERAKATSR